MTKKFIQITLVIGLISPVLKGMEKWPEIIISHSKTNSASTYSQKIAGETKLLCIKYKDTGKFDCEIPQSVTIIRGMRYQTPSREVMVPPDASSPQGHYRSLFYGLKNHYKEQQARKKNEK